MDRNRYAEGCNITTFMHHSSSGGSHRSYATSKCFGRHVRPRDLSESGLNAKYDSGLGWDCSVCATARLHW